MGARFIEPHPLKAKLLAWSELNVNEVDSIITVFRSKNVNEIYCFLQNMFNLNMNDLKCQILLDLHYYAIKFALDNEFSKIQLSSFVSIIRALHRANQETPFDNYELLNKYFYELIKCHSIKRPPFCLDIFGTQAAAKVINYIRTSYLRHYKSYKYVFTPIVGLDLFIEYPNRTPTPTQPEVEQEHQAETETSQQSKNEISNQSEQNHIEQTKDEEPRSREMREYVRNVLLEHIETENLKEKLHAEFSGRIRSGEKRQKRSNKI